VSRLKLLGGASFKVRVKDEMGRFACHGEHGEAGHPGGPFAGSRVLGSYDSKIHQGCCLGGERGARWDGAACPTTRLNRRRAGMNVTFQIETLTNSDGTQEIVKVECEPTTDEVGGAVNVHDIGVGAWEFQFVVPADFDDTDPIFRQFERYGVDGQDVCEACTQAWQSVQADTVRM
jgi:hypothetical protein